LLVLKICDEQSDEQVMNNFLYKSQFKTTNVIVVKSSNTHQILRNIKTSTLYYNRSL